MSRCPILKGVGHRPIRVRRKGDLMAKSIFTEPARIVGRVYAAVNERDGDLRVAAGGDDLDAYYRTPSFTLNFEDDTVELVIRVMSENNMTVLVVSEHGRPVYARAWPRNSSDDHPF